MAVEFQKCSVAGYRDKLYVLCDILNGYNVIDQHLILVGDVVIMLMLFIKLIAFNATKYDVNVGYATILVLLHNLHIYLLPIDFKLIFCIFTNVVYCWNYLYLFT